MKYKEGTYMIITAETLFYETKNKHQIVSSN